MATNWKSVILPKKHIKPYSDKCNYIRMPLDTSLQGLCGNYGITVYIPAKFCHFIGSDSCKICYLPHFSYAEFLEEFVAMLDLAKTKGITHWL